MDNFSLEGINEIVLSTHLEAANLKEGETYRMQHILLDFEFDQCMPNKYKIYKPNVTIFKIIDIADKVALCEVKVDNLNITCHVHCEVPILDDLSMITIRRGYVLLTTMDPLQIKVGGLYNMKHFILGQNVDIAGVPVFIEKVIEKSENMIVACCYREDALCYYIANILCNV